MSLSKGFRPRLPLPLTLWVFVFALGCAPEADHMAVDAGVDPPTAPTPVVGDADIHHHLRFDDAARHLVDVESRFPAASLNDGGLTLMMAVWTPGSYLVREYSRHVEGLGATDAAGRPLTVEKISKNRWRVTVLQPQPTTAETPGDVVVRYRLYAREMSVRTNFVDADLAMLNGAPTFLVPVGGEALSHNVSLHLPAGWTDSATALFPVEGREHVYRAPDFDTLVDSPILIGDLDRRGFSIDGVPHELVHMGDFEHWDLERAVSDVAKLTQTQVDFWGSIPYPHYLYLNAVTESGGGLEHKASTLMLSGRWRDGTERGYRRWLGLVSHEFFHTWNVKRLRPHTLGPFDYEAENYTHSLWFAEGLTSYYGPLLLHRAGLITEKQLLDDLSSSLGRTQNTPGRAVRSLADSSFDAWIKHYRPDENSRNTSVDYYGKGAVVGFLLDAEIRRRSGGDRSLDDVMRLAYERFSGEQGFRPEDVRAVVAEVAGESLDDFFDRFVDGTEELDLRPALDWYGLRLKEQKTDGDEADEAAGYLGSVHRSDDGRLIVSRVPRGTPAWEAGLNADDEILAIDDYRITETRWSDRMKQYPPGSQAELLISRRGKLRRLPVTFAEEPQETWKLRVDGEANARARQRRTSWLDG